MQAARDNDPPCGPERILADFGRIDIYVFDQLLRGRIRPDMSVLDAGCGGARNVEYLMRCGAQVFGVDQDPAQVERARAVAADAAPGLPATNFRTAHLAALPFPDARFDVVICSAVLHFSEDSEAFEAAVREMWRVLAPGVCSSRGSRPPSASKPGSSRSIGTGGTAFQTGATGFWWTRRTSSTRRPPSGPNSWIHSRRRWSRACAP